MEKHPAHFPVSFANVEYPAHFVFFEWVRELESTPDLIPSDRPIGECNTFPPDQDLWWEENQIVARSKHARERPNT